MTELQSALAQLAERGSAAGAAEVTQRALDQAGSGRAPQRRHWAARVVTIAAAVLALMVAASALYVRDKTNDVDRIDLAGALAEPAALETMNILVVGVDTRVGANETARGDSTAVVRVSRVEGVVAVLSIPRDLYVEGANVVDGVAVPDRINVAATDPRRLVGIVQRETGLRVDHFAELDSVGFRRIIDALGGVTLRLAAPVRDRLSGLDLPAGCVHLGGEEALAWDRARHLESYEDGQWTADPTGDLGRIQRQQQLAVVALRKLAAARDPRTLSRLLDVAADNLRVDETFPFGRLRDWANAAVQRRSGLAMVLLPTTPAVVGDGANVLLLDRTHLADAVSVFDAPPSTPHAPSESDCE